MKDLKRIEHRHRCRWCQAVADIKRGGHYYCALCFHISFQVPGPRQDLGALEPVDIVGALQGGLVTGRTAAAILDRVLKERTV